MRTKRYELSPCPHCGGKAYLERSHRAYIHAETTRVAFVRCMDCEARTARYSTEIHGQRQAEELAVESWNRRAIGSDKLQAAVVTLYEHCRSMTLCKDCPVYDKYGSCAFEDLQPMHWGAAIRMLRGEEEEDD